LKFCNITLSPAHLSLVYELPQKPKSFNRYKEYNIDIFSKEQIDFVLKMGFEV
jgi:hypothetical protein